MPEHNMLAHHLHLSPFLPLAVPCRSQAMPGHNMLGLEIRDPIIERANRWAEHLALQRTVLFLRCGWIGGSICLPRTVSCPAMCLDGSCTRCAVKSIPLEHRLVKTGHRAIH